MKLHKFNYIYNNHPKKDIKFFPQNKDEDVHMNFQEKILLIMMMVMKKDLIILSK